MEKISPLEIKVYEKGSPEWNVLDVIAATMESLCPKRFWGEDFEVADIWFDYDAKIMRTTITYKMKKNGESVQALMPDEQADFMNAGTIRELSKKVTAYFAERIARGYTDN